MRGHHTIGVCVAAGSLVLGACQAWNAAHEPARAGARVVVVPRGDAATGHFEISSGALVRRHEAQAALDTARDALGAGAPARAASALRDAAHFFAGHAGPGAAARADLQGTTAALLRLASTLDSGEEVAPAAVVAASARANRAEAEHHRLAAVDAWRRAEHTDTGDELGMAVDHLERALLDEGRPVPAATRQLLTNAWTTAGVLMRDGAPPASEVDATLAALGRVIETR